MTLAETLAFPCPSCSAPSGSECADDCETDERLTPARAHRTRDACPECSEAAGTWCYCVERMDRAQPGATVPAMQLDLFARTARGEVAP